MRLRNKRISNIVQWASFGLLDFSSFKHFVQNSWFEELEIMLQIEFAMYLQFSVLIALFLSFTGIVSFGFFLISVGFRFFDDLWILRFIGLILSLFLHLKILLSYFFHNLRQEKRILRICWYLLQCFFIFHTCTNSFSVLCKMLPNK